MAAGVVVLLQADMESTASRLDRFIGSSGWLQGPVDGHVERSSGKRIAVKIRDGAANSPQFRARGWRQREPLRSAIRQIADRNRDEEIGDELELGASADELSRRKIE